MRAPNWTVANPGTAYRTEFDSSFREVIQIKGLSSVVKEDSNSNIANAILEDVEGESVDQAEFDPDAFEPRKGKVWPHNQVEGEDEVSTDVPEDEQKSDSNDEELHDSCKNSVVESHREIGSSLPTRSGCRPSVRDEATSQWRHCPRSTQAC